MLKLLSLYQERKKVTIKSKLIKIQLGLVFSVLLSCSGFFFFNDILIVKKSIERTLETTAKVLGRNLGPTIVFSDRKEAEKVLSTLQSEPRISSAVLYDSNGGVFSAYGSDHLDGDRFNFREVSLGSHVDGRNLNFVFEIARDGDVQGWLVLRANVFGFYNEYLIYLFIFVCVTVFGLLLSVWLAEVFQRELSGPIVGFAETVKKISESGDASLRMKNESIGGNIIEVDFLSNEFNQMLNSLQQKESKITLEKEEAIKANEAKSIFLSNMSHELRTPLHGIISFSRFGIQRVETVEKAVLRSYFKEVYDSAQDLLRLLNNLLDLSRLESGKVSYSRMQGDLVDCVKSVQAEMSAFAEEKGLKIEVSSSNESIMAEFDFDGIKQVVRNLLSNAIKFSDQGSNISISVEKDSTVARCKIVNQGIGIPSAELDSIFDKFVQSSKTRTGAGGTGLGLAICKEIIQQHGGKIWAKSSLNGLTQFTLELPV